MFSPSETTFIRKVFGSKYTDPILEEFEKKNRRHPVTGKPWSPEQLRQTVNRIRSNEGLEKLIIDVAIKVNKKKAAEKARRAREMR